MTPITDPNVIAKLEGSGGQSLGKPVTDPNLISQLDGNMPQASNPSLAFRLTGDAAAGLADAGQGLHNFLARAVTPILGKYAPAQTNIDFGKTFGVNNPNLGDKLVQGAAQYAPYMLGGAEVMPAGQAVGSVPSLGARLANQMRTGYVFGSTQSDNPVTGGVIGATLGAGSELAPTTFGAARSGISKLTRAIQPQKYAEQLMQNLGSGHTLEGNAQSLAQDIKGAFGNRVSQGQALYGPVFDAAGNNSIYDGVNQAVVRQPVQNFKSVNDVIDHINDATGNDLETATDLKDYLMQQHGFAFPNNKNLLDFFNSAPVVINNGAYNALDDGIINSYDRNLTALHQRFTDNPTLQNAHNLQSQLGSSIRKLQANDAKGNLSVADRNTMQGYQAAQDAVRSDIDTYLTSQNPALANQYNLATANWAQNVTPYLENSKIAKIAKGDVTNPTAIANLFKNPEPEMQQIVSDIGPQANNKILYSELGKTQANLTPEKLTGLYNQLDKKGLASYVTPDLAQQFEQLGGKIAARNMAQTAASGVLGAHFLGPLGAIAGAAGPTVFRKLGQIAPSVNLPLRDSLLNVLRAGYKPTTNAVQANLINYQEG